MTPRVAANRAERLGRAWLSHALDPIREGVAASIPGARLHVLEPGGHPVIWECQEVGAEALLPFLAR